LLAATAGEDQPPCLQRTLHLRSLPDRQPQLLSSHTSVPLCHGKVPAKPTGSSAHFHTFSCDKQKTCAQSQATACQVEDISNHATGFREGGTLIVLNRILHGGIFCQRYTGSRIICLLMGRLDGHCHWIRAHLIVTGRNCCLLQIISTCIKTDNIENTGGFSR